MEPADFRLVSSILPVKSVKTHKINLNNMRKKYNIKQYLLPLQRSIPVSD